MATSPVQLILERQAATKKQANMAEAQVDEYLRQHFDGTRSVCVPAKSLGPDPLTRKEVVRRFAEVGWKVRLVADQRDGDLYEFSA